MNIPLHQTQSYIKEKGSKFYGLVFPLNSKDDIDFYLKETSVKFPKATHYCYAWALGENRNEYRINDDGEPSGSAGLPIFNQIRSKDSTQVLVVVVRYYGGSKLGVPGLISCYGKAAEDALNLNEWKIYTEKVSAQVICDYSTENLVRNYLKMAGAEVITQQNDLKVCLRFSMDKNNWKIFYDTYKDAHQFDLALIS